MTRKIIVKYYFRYMLCLFLIYLGLIGCDIDETSEVEFTNLRVEEITSTRAVVRFETSRPTTCEVEYGLTESDLIFHATDPSMDPMTPYSIDHEVPLEDLQPDTTYYHRAMAIDPSGNIYYSEIGQFQTMVEEDNDNWLNIALLAMGTTVSAVSSNFGGGDNDSTWGANKAIDGEMTTEWASAGDGDDAYIEIDFGTLRTVERFGFRSRKMSDGTSIIKSVRLIFDGGFEELGPFEVPDPDHNYMFDFDEPINAQSVRIEAIITTGGNTGAKEIQFFMRN
jgi:hypothetical protein